MIGELNYMDYYSSGFILDRPSNSLKLSIIKRNKYNNKEEVKPPNWHKCTSSFFDKGGSSICKHYQ